MIRDVLEERDPQALIWWATLPTRLASEHAMLLRAIAFALVAVSPLTAQTVITVSGSAPADFTDLPAAAAAANDGDVILVGTGTYSGFTLDGKGVVVEGDGNVTVIGEIVVTNVPLTSYVAIRNVDVDADAVGGPKAGFRLESSDGSILLKECTVDKGAPGIDVNACADVMLMSTTADGRFGSVPLNSLPGSGLRAANSNVSLHSCEFEGGTGAGAVCIGAGSNIDAQMGGTGIELINSFLFTAESTAYGGYGGDGCDNKDTFDCLDGGMGGSGVAVDVDSEATDLGGAGFDGGPGGSTPGAFAFCFDGVYGNPWDGELANLNIAGRTTSVTSPERVGDVVDVTVGGETGDTVLLLISTPSAPFGYVKKLNGVVLSPSFLSIFLGTLGAPATFNLSAVVPDIAPFDAATIALQGVFVDTSGDVVLGSVSHLTIVP